MSDAHPELGDPTRNLLHLIGEAISEDVSAWDWLDDWTLIVTRGGRTFVVRAHEEREPELVSAPIEITSREQAVELLGPAGGEAWGEHVGALVVFPARKR